MEDLGWPTERRPAYRFRAHAGKWLMEPRAPVTTPDNARRHLVAEIARWEAVEAAERIWRAAGSGGGEEHEKLCVLWEAL